MLQHTWVHSGHPSPRNCAPAYMGFMMLMGLVKLPSMYDYWGRDEVFHYSAIAGRITRDRFCELHRFLHFVDNCTLSTPGTPGYDNLGKIRPIYSQPYQIFFPTSRA